MDDRSSGKSRAAWSITLFMLSIVILAMAIFWWTNLVYVVLQKQKLNDFGAKISTSSQFIFDITSLLSDFSVVLIPVSALFFLGGVILFRHVLSREKLVHAFALISCIVLLVGFSVIFLNTSQTVGKAMDARSKT